MTIRGPLVRYFRANDFTIIALVLGTLTLAMLLLMSCQQPLR